MGHPVFWEFLEEEITELCNLLIIIISHVFDEQKLF